MALSRPYVGVHYPSDIIAGGAIGAIIGYLFALLSLSVDNYFEKRKFNITLFRKKGNPK